MYRAIPFLIEAWYDAVQKQFGPSSEGDTQPTYLKTHEQEFQPRLPQDIKPSLFPWCFHAVTGGSGELKDSIYSMTGRLQVYKATISMGILTMARPEQTPAEQYRISNPYFGEARAALWHKMLREGIAEVPSQLYRFFPTAAEIHAWSQAPFDNDGRRGLYDKHGDLLVDSPLLDAGGNRLPVDALPSVMDLGAYIDDYMNLMYKPAQGFETNHLIPPRDDFAILAWSSHGFQVLNHPIHREVAPHDTRLIKVWQFNYEFDIQECF